MHKVREYAPCAYQTAGKTQHSIMPMNRSKAYHGGAFFEAIGEDFSSLNKAAKVINADVLDAWFDPSPKVIQILQNYTEFIVKTSPPTHCKGLIKTISDVRGVPKDAIITGGGSSDIIFAIFPQLINQNSKVLILDPMYGEYAHFVENIAQSRIVRHQLSKHDGFEINVDQLKKDINTAAPGLAVLVNPNSPTGKYCGKESILNIVKANPLTLFVVDETYIEYVDKNESLEKHAARLNNLIIIKSMSKVYALSGARVAYMVSHRKICARLSGFIPPWSVSLPGQIAGVKALQDPEYYQDKYDKTHHLRNKYIRGLGGISSIVPIDATANFFLIELKRPGKSASKIISELKKQNIFLRNCDSMSRQFNDNYIRITVRDGKSNDLVTKALAAALDKQQ